MYSALNIAKFIINHGISQRTPVSNLRLQKLLYFVWVEYYKNTCDKMLFDDEFSAWSFGPVIPIVYADFCMWGGFPITTRQDVSQPTSPDVALIERILERYSAFTTGRLVKFTHEPGTPWSLTFDKGNGNKRTIPFARIMNCERSRLV